MLQATGWLIGLADLSGDQAEAARLSPAGLRTQRAGRAKLGTWACRIAATAPRRVLNAAT